YRHANRLAGRQEGREVAADARDHRDRPGVHQLRESLAAILVGNLDPERAEPTEAVDDPRRHLTVAIDRIGVDLFQQELLELGEKRGGTGHVFRLGLGKWMDQVEPQAAAEELSDEAFLP